MKLPLSAPNDKSKNSEKVGKFADKTESDWHIKLLVRKFRKIARTVKFLWTFLKLGSKQGSLMGVFRRAAF